MRAPQVRRDHATRVSTEGAIACDMPQPAQQGRYIQLVHYIKLKSCRIFWRSGSRPWLHGSKSALSSGMTKFILKVSKSLVFRHECAIDTCVDPDSHLPQQSSAQLVNALDFNTLGWWSGIWSLHVFY